MCIRDSPQGVVPRKAEHCPAVHQVFDITIRPLGPDAVPGAVHALQAHETPMRPVGVLQGDEGEVLFRRVTRGRRWPRRMHPHASPARNCRPARAESGRAHGTTLSNRRRGWCIGGQGLQGIGALQRTRTWDTGFAGVASIRHTGVPLWDACADTSSRERFLGQAPGVGKLGAAGVVGAADPLHAVFDARLDIALGQAEL